MVNLTTILLHTSVEWISSDWLVCQLSETSAPRRMGDATRCLRWWASPARTISTPQTSSTTSQKETRPQRLLLLPTPALSRRPTAHFQIGSPTIPLVREKLGAEESAAIGAQLIQEIETLPKDGLQPRAIAILKAKNRLSADDAKRVEDAFAARMACKAHCRML
jgi:hypothetical protein